MNRKLRTLTLVAMTLFALLIPASIVSALGVSEHQSDDFGIPLSVLTIDSHSSPPPALLRANSIEYDLPPPPPERDRSFCEDVPRLCEWLAHHGKLIDPEPATSEDDQSEQGSTNENRSVVSWNSGSVSTMVAEASPEPVNLEVPSLSILANVTGVGVDSNRSMQVPDYYNTVGWYKHGPIPGEAGSAAIAGHLDDSRGRSVFYDLQHVEIGARITVGFEDGSTKHFEITEKNSFDAANLPSGEIFARDGEPRLALITCGGRWDSSAGRYSETVVIYAEPV